MDLSAEHERLVSALAEMVAEIAGHAGTWDRQGGVDDRVIGQLGERGWLAPNVPGHYGGAGLDELSIGLLCESLGSACSSTRSLVTVQAMVAAALLRWGSDDQRDRWLPALASGDAVAGFCLTEPDVGSDAAAVATAVTKDGGTVRLTGFKRWVTFGQRADVYLVVGAGPTAVLVERDTPGLSVHPIAAQLGLRAARLADIVLDACAVPAANVVGRPGAGFVAVANTALDIGRYTVAWGCAGLGAACRDASYQYARERRQFGVPLVDHQLVRRLLTNMLVDVRAARLLCADAAAARQARSPTAVADTIIAKYAAARMVNRVAPDAVQVHGAAGIGAGHDVERYLRDAKVMQIIEGTDQMHQVTIADYGMRAHGRKPP